MLRMLTLVVFLTTSSVASAQNTSLELTGFATSGERVTVTAEVVAGKGDRPAELQITARTLPGWHIYSITQKSGGPKPFFRFAPDKANEAN